MSKNKLLIVEDLDSKAKDITSYIKQLYPDVEISHTESYNSSLKEIYNNPNKYDGILLDMTMTTFDVSEEDNGGAPEPLAGQQILDGMYLREINVPVIVVTMFNSFDGMGLKEFDATLKEEYGEFYKGYVSYAAKSNDWKQSMANFLNEIYG